MWFRKSFGCWHISGNKRAKNIKVRWRDVRYCIAGLADLCTRGKNTRCTCLFVNKPNYSRFAWSMLFLLEIYYYEVALFIYTYASFSVRPTTNRTFLCVLSGCVADRAEVGRSPICTQTGSVGCLRTFGHCTCRTTHTPSTSYTAGVSEPPDNKHVTPCNINHQPTRAIEEYIL